MTNTISKYAQMTSDQIFNDMLTNAHALKATQCIDNGVDPGEAVGRANLDMSNLVAAGDLFAGMDQPNF